ncbi:MAG: T9SS type A sorting domain-containing protein [Bacteroidales bacterium]|jgi:hypothetical protein
MKKITMIVAVIISMAIKTNAQIPNYGFENWIDHGSYMDPQFWATTNIYSNGSFYSVTRSTDHYPASVGSYSIRIENNTSYIADTLGLGDIQANLIDVLAPRHPAFPITGNPTQLTGYFKYFPLNGDTMHIGSHLYKNGSMVASGGILLDSTFSNWTPFVINYPAYSSADSAFINISAYNSSSTGLGYPHGNSVLYVDNLNFGPLISGISAYNADNNLFELYPNPASDIITLNITNKNNADYILNIYSVIGTLVKSEMLKQNQQQISIRDLSNGVYMITVKLKDLTENQRLVIQR